MIRPAGMTALEAEIRQQPAALRRLLEAEHANVAALATGWRERGDVTAVMLAARGTSDNAARYAQYVLGVHNRLAVALATPSLFGPYAAPPRLNGMLVGAISQSGRSPDVVGVVAEAARQGRPTVALTNDVRSPLAEAAAAVVGLHAGPERSVAATKTYTASLAALALMSVALDPGAGRLAALRGVPQHVDAAVEASLAGIAAPDWLVEAPAWAVVGRGFNYATAFELALKVKELTGIAAEPYSSADFLHGPVAAVSWRMPVVLVAPSGVTGPEVLGLVDRLRERGARLAILSDDAGALERADLPLPLPAGVDEWLSPLTAIVPGQVLALRIAEARGLDVDRPTGLRKVTETR